MECGNGIVEIEGGITKISFSDQFFMHIQVMCLGFLFSQLQTYIRIILKVIIRLLHLLLQAYRDQRQFALVHFSLEKTFVFVRLNIKMIKKNLLKDQKYP